jgi:hypothetical protein
LLSARSTQGNVVKKENLMPKENELGLTHENESCSTCGFHAVWMNKTQCRRIQNIRAWAWKGDQEICEHWCPESRQMTAAEAHHAETGD